MRIGNVVRVVSFAEVEGGNIVKFFDIKGNLRVGMKVRSDQSDGVLVLKSHLASEQGDIWWVHDNALSPWDDIPLLEYPDAVLVAKEFALLPSGRAAKSGDLTIHNDGTMMYLSKSSGSPLSAVYVDMKTGKTTRANDTANPSLVLSKWIVVPSVEGDEALIEAREDRAAP